MMTGRLEEKQKKISIDNSGKLEIEWFMTNSRISITVSNEYLNSKIAGRFTPIGSLYMPKGQFRTDSCRTRIDEDHASEGPYITELTNGLKVVSGSRGGNKITWVTIYAAHQEKTSIP